MDTKEPIAQPTAVGMERKLAAILSADVQGYSRLMGDDEEATIRTLTAYREVMTALIKQHRGRVVDSPGDNLLAEFASAVDAVQGAVAIQKELKIRNAELPTQRQMHYRIGVNVGDVVVEGERLYGDGVNIAARVESLAEGGGISISEAVHMQVKNKLPPAFTSQGEQSVKNIADPVHVYKVMLDAEAAATPPVAVLEPPAELPLPDKPSIAVLPFTNMSNDPEQEYFSDGITDDIITDLSKISGLFVIARNSTFTYKGQAVKVADVGRELGVRHVLEGSVRKAGNRVRINVQLINAPTGGHVWAERYDRELTDIFALQDEITQKIVFALKVNLLPEEQARFKRAPTTNLDAYDYYLRGLECYGHGSAEAALQARRQFERAIEVDPTFAGAHASIGMTYFLEWVSQGILQSQLLDRAAELTQHAVILDDLQSSAHTLLGWISLFQGRHERALDEIRRAIALNPNDAEAYARLGAALSMVGRPEETFALVEKAMRLEPHYPFYYLLFLGLAYHLTGQAAKAVEALKRSLTRSPNFVAAHMYLAAIYSELGLMDEAQAEIVTIRQVSPQFSLEAARQRIPFKDLTVLDRYLIGLRKAGLE